MIGIIKRDILLILSSKQTILLMLFYIPFLMILAESFHPESFYFVIIVLYTFLLSMSSFTYDISGKSKYIMNSLPINRKELVVYKYLSIFVYLGMTIVFAGVYLWIIHILGLANVDYFSLRVIKNTIPIVMLYSAVVFPVYIRFEPRIGQILSLFVFILFFTTIGNLSYTRDKAILKFLSLMKWEYYMAIALLLYLLSLLLSISLYKEKDI